MVTSIRIHPIFPNLPIVVHVVASASTGSALIVRFEAFDTRLFNCGMYGLSHSAGPPVSSVNAIGSK
jgi:hypothetical protein